MERDIVERLRDDTMQVGLVPLCREAADEIESLRRAIARLFQNGKFVPNDTHT